MDLTTVRDWRRPASAADLALVPGEAYVAGGTWLFSEPQRHLTGLVDLTALGWPPFEFPADRPGWLRVAATCTIADLQRWDWSRPVDPVVRACADALLMSWKVQQQATVGGNLCLALPAGAMISLFAGLGAEALIRTADGTERSVPVADFVTGVGTTVLRPGEHLRAIDVPPSARNPWVGVRRISLADQGRSAALVLGHRDRDALVLTVTASTPRPVVLRLPREATAAEVGGAVRGIGAGVGWYDDPHGAPDWRAAMTERLALELRLELVG